MEGRGLLQNVVLLIVTAVLSGLLIPYVNARMGAEQTLREQEEAARKARQASVIHAQEQFLEHLERSLFDFNMRAAAVPWYRSMQLDEAKFAVAREAYDAESWKFMGTMYVLLSQGKRLTSPAAYKVLKDHHHQWENLDADIIKAIGKDPGRKQWRVLLDRVNDQAQASETVLDTLARDYGLVPGGMALQEAVRK